MTADRPSAPYDPAAPQLSPAGGPTPLRHQPLLRLLFVNWLIGAGVALVLVVAVLVTDTAHLRSLMMASDQPWIPLFLLFFGFLVTMCSVAMATAVMLLPGDDESDGSGGGSAPATVETRTPVPVRVAVRSNTRRRR
ncbi:hypothetical protein EYW49_01630 [Siculibacillus lacustris]|uniref:Uncharacterized protein n=1 Tax=Siculibacillus lacustris TaxID=1549641 RepID=A0A4Q9VZ39_9HYPH|nr:hypothetical protein [Siculibacillus lacustris]TBW40879.1 hypothetical protein EYW49_01630 [Siculibacillus lacustris]